MKCDDSTEGCSTTAVPKMFPTAEGEYFEGDSYQ
jgi:hypothetical protein